MLLSSILAALRAPTDTEFMSVIVSIWAIYSMYAKSIEVKANQAKIANPQGSQTDPVHLKQPFTVEKVKQYVEVQDLAELRKQVSDMREENAAEHKAARQAGENRVAAIAQSVGSDIAQIKTSIESLKDRLVDKLDETVSAAYDRINDHGERIAAVEALQGIKHGKK